ncbi:hypothetical protein [Actinomadura rupiterrae]|uniref:hypothetical protein n=1 Tax=Actinomadura rupiterrae TaxID=559627 RepID=UPI0020A495D1|nr:hypothetical protein [Actinomadura rupiterrae]MCP2336180.1 hypothetical protein [Actinomadura rupiterrae]
MKSRARAAVVAAGAVTTVAVAVAAVLFGSGAFGSGPPLRAHAGLDARTTGHAPVARVLGRYAMPSGGETSASFQGLAAAHGTVWVSGTSGPLGKAGSPSGFVLRYQGGRLAKLDAPLKPGTSEGGDVSAVGGLAWVLASDKGGAELLTTDGRTWRQDVRPTRRGFGAYGVTAVSERDIWVSGAKPDDHGDKQAPVLLHYDGTAWHRTDKGVGGDHDVLLFGMTARASNDVWTAGQRSLGTKNLDATPFLAHWDGRSWRRAHTPVRLGFVRSVAALTGADAWAVGGTDCSCSSEAGPLVLHYDGKTWRRTTTSGLRRALESVVQDGRGGLWAAESGGRVLHFDGRAWRPATLPGQASATAVARDPQTGRIYAIADEPEQNDKVTGLLLELG